MDSKLNSRHHTNTVQQLTWEISSETKRTVIALFFCWLFSDCLKYRTEYDDNAQFNNLETLIVQNNVDTVYTYGSVETGKLQHIAKLLEQLDVKLQIVKKR